MTSEESSELRQKNELEALQAIYGNDIRDLRGKSVWNKWKPLDLSITVTPSQSSEGTNDIFVKIDLHVVCDEKYPDSVPKISLENGKGLSNVVLLDLKEILVKRANKLKGEEQIFQLVQEVQEFLDKHNKPGAKSFYDEMLKRHKEKEEYELMIKKIEEEQQKQDICEELKKRQDMQQTETKQSSKDEHVSEDNKDEDKKYPIFHSVLAGNSPCNSESIDLIEFGTRFIQRGRCVKHSSERHTIYCGLDNNTGDLSIVNEWTFDVPSENELPLIRKQIGRIEQEVNYLTKLKHPNLSECYGIAHTIKNNKLSIFFSSQFIIGIPLNIFVDQKIRIDMVLFNNVAKSVLTALDYLHRNNVIHKYVEESNVYITNQGVVKLTDYSIHRRVLDISSKTPKTYNRKTDIFRFGIMLLSLLHSKNVCEENFEIPSSVNSDLYDFLTKCLAKEESDRYTTNQLLNHIHLHNTMITPDHGQEEKLADILPDDIRKDLKLLAQFVPNGQSRIETEFEFIEHLGAGAFGDVTKARNILDGGIYAIKKIILNPKNKTLNKKTIREVKLLSRLNHENVVRYYNSWIEANTIREDECKSPEDGSSSQETEPEVKKKDELTIDDSIEKNAPPAKNVEVSIIYDSKSQAAITNGSDEESSDSDESEEEEEEEEESELVVFQRDSAAESKVTPILTVEEKTDKPKEEIDELEEKTDKPKEKLGKLKRIDFMYIQMEFCEKCTLRSAIDENLYLDENRTFRLFREIVEGLAYIHQQGMIHRDLKPVNIFLDSADHVKIGDFGLATTNRKSKLNEAISGKKSPEVAKEDTADDSKSGMVGTALYVAPEVKSSGNKIVYTQKVDIYSLGIICFEMCSKPFETAMERIKVLTKLRSKEIIFPEDFNNKKKEKHVSLIRWLLNHDVSQRPTSMDLLQSEYLPPPVVEERELRELIRHTLTNPQMKGYKYLIASCFTQPVTDVQDITYDGDPSHLNMMKSSALYDFVTSICVKIFKQHGGQNLVTPLLMPKSKLYENVESYVKVMTYFGGIVSLPYDLRVPFARFVARNSITLLRRYAIERVYRENKLFGFQPREMYECAFDIVTPKQDSHMTDAEVIYIVNEIISELPGLNKRSYFIKINHTDLLTAILLHCGIKENHSETISVICNAKVKRTPKSQLQNHFITLRLSDNMINTLMNLLYSEFEISKAIHQFQVITKKKNAAGKLANKALKDLKLICQIAQAYGVKYDFIVNPNLAFPVQQYSGMSFQFVLEKKRKHKSVEVIAAGGRYDEMITFYRSTMEKASILSNDVHQAAVGVSISLETLVQAIQKEQSEDVLPKDATLNVAVCFIGKETSPELTRVMKNLWTAGIRSTTIENINLEDIEDKIKDLNITHVVILKEGELGTVRYRSLNKERFQEKSIPTNDLVDSLQRSMKNSNDNSQETTYPNVLSRSESRSSCDHIQQDVIVEICFITNDKITSNFRKRYDNQIRSELEPLFKKLNGYVVVFGISVEAHLIRSLTSFLDFDSDHQFQESVETIMERNPKCKEFIKEICDVLRDYKMKPKSRSMVLYSLTDGFYAVIM